MKNKKSFRCVYHVYKHLPKYKKGYCDICLFYFKPYPKLIIKNEKSVASVCFLRDKRLVSGGKGGIAVYNSHTYQVDFIIEEDAVKSVCELRNGYLASCCGNLIKIYEINGNEQTLIHTLEGHTDAVNKVIELEDGRLCSCSDDKTIRIWDNNYQHVQTLSKHNEWVISLIEMNDYIISTSNDNDGVRIWNKATYDCVKTIKRIYCIDSNGISKLKDNILILGGRYELFSLDILSFQYQIFPVRQLGSIESICTLREGKVLIGNSIGKIICYNSSLNKIISIQQIHNTIATCIIKDEDNTIFSSSYDGTIKVYDSFHSCINYNLL